MTTQPEGAILVTRRGEVHAHAGGEPPRPRSRGSRDRTDVATVNVTHVGIGFVDALARAGNYPLAPRRPHPLGYEFAGTTVDGPRPGTRVSGLLTTMGATRSRIRVPSDLVIEIPDGVDGVTAAAIPLNYLTALAMLRKIARLEPGQSVLVHGAAGGVGSAVLDLASLWGIEAYGTASPAKHDTVRSRGGTPIDYTRGDWLAKALELRPDGYDAVLDPFGGRVQRESWRALAPRGRLVSYGFYADVRASLLASILGVLFLRLRDAWPDGRRASLAATPAIVRADRAWYRTSMSTLLDLAAKGRLRPLIDSVVPAGEIDSALDRIVQKKTRGKTVVDMTTSTRRPSRVEGEAADMRVQSERQGRPSAVLVQRI